MLQTNEQPDLNHELPAAAAPPKPFFSDFIDLIYGIFFTPVATLREVAQRPRAPLGVALGIYFVVLFINGLASGGVFVRQFAAMSAEMGAGPMAGLPLGSGFVVTAVLAGLLVGPVGLYFKAGALNLTASLFGGTGEGRRLLTAFALTFTPVLVTVPFGLLMAGQPNLATLANVITVGVLVWRLVLDIIAIRTVYGFDSGRAVATALVPLGVLILVGVIFFFVIMFSMVGMLGPFMQSGMPGIG